MYSIESLFYKINGVYRGKGRIEIHVEDAVVKARIRKYQGDITEITPPVLLDIYVKNGELEVLANTGLAVKGQLGKQPVYIVDQECRVEESNGNWSIKCRYIYCWSRKHRFHEKHLELYDGHITPMGIDDVLPYNEDLFIEFVKEMARIGVDQGYEPGIVGDVLWLTLSNNNNWIIVDKETRKCLIHAYRHYNPYKLVEYANYLGAKEIYAGGSSWRGTARIIADALNNLLREKRYDYIHFYAASFLSPVARDFEVQNQVLGEIKKRFKIILLPPFP